MFDMITQYTSPSLCLCYLTANSASPTLAPTVALTMPPTYAPTGPSAVPTIQPSVATSYCMNYCVTSPGIVINVTQGGIFGNRLIIPKYFEFSFKVKGVTLAGSAGLKRNILEFQGESGPPLLSVFVTDTTLLEYRYNGIVVTSTGPALVPNYASEHTTVTMTVTELSMTIETTQSPPVDFILSANTETANIGYTFFVSRPGGVSSGGVIEEAAFYGKSKFYSKLTNYCVYVLLLLLSCFPLPQD